MQVRPCFCFSADSFSAGALVGDLASGRPANGLREAVRGAFESVRRCVNVSVGMIGMLLLADSVGRSSTDDGSCARSVLVRSRRLFNLDGGGGLEPEGRESFVDLRLER